MDSKSKESFGQYLRRERTLREIPLEEIARFTKIKMSTLVSLENDDFERMPGIAFVRGFVRAYAEYLGLNLQEVMFRFTSYINENHPELTAEPAPVRERTLISRPLILVFFAILILAFFFYSYRYMNRLEERRQSETGALAGSSASSVGPSPADYTVIEIGQGDQRLQMKATELCWIQVILDDKPPCEATLYPGDSVYYEAEGRIRLLIGNAGGIKVKYNDTSLGDLGPSGRPIRLSFPVAEAPGQPPSGE